MIQLTDDRGPAVSGLHKDVTVAEALVNGEWWLSASRSRNAIITLLKQCLPPSEPIVISSSDDKYLWRMGNDSLSNVFSTAKTWSTLHPPNPPVFWHSQVWFAGRIPKHAFISWLGPGTDWQLETGLEFGVLKYLQTVSFVQGVKSLDSTCSLTVYTAFRYGCTSALASK